MVRPASAALRRAVAVALAASVAVGCDDARDAVDDELVTATDGVLTVAAALPSPGFWDGDDPTTVDGGFEHGLATALADRFDLDLRVVAVPFERIVAGDLGGADLALAQIERTDERERVLELSVGYLDTGFGIVQRADAPDDDVVTDLAAARELSWAAVAGSREERMLIDVVDPEGGVVTAALEIDAIDTVASGAADAALVDLGSALVLTADRPGLATTAQVVTDGRYVAALPRGSSNVELVDAALRAFARDGTLDDLEERWLLAEYALDPHDVPVIRARS